MKLRYYKAVYTPNGKIIVNEYFLGICLHWGIHSRFFKSIHAANLYINILNRQK